MFYRHSVFYQQIITFLCYKSVFDHAWTENTSKREVLLLGNEKRSLNVCKVHVTKNFPQNLFQFAQNSTQNTIHFYLLSSILNASMQRLANRLTSHRFIQTSIQIRSTRMMFLSHSDWVLVCDLVSTITVVNYRFACSSLFRRSTLIILTLVASIPMKLNEKLLN